MGYKIINAVSDRYVPKWGNSKEYIAIHYLGVDGQNHELEPDGTGAHYYIYWDGTIYQRCSHDAIVWAVGTGGMYQQKHPYARNANTISIEMCCHCDGNAASADDPYWYFTQETQNACIWLVQKLMKDLKIPITNVLRHYDIVNKVCPAPYVHNNQYKGSWTWNEFLNRANNITPTDKPSGKPKSKADFIEKVGAIASVLMQETNILASVVTAQACLETGYGLGRDADVLVEVNNLLGMKTDLINATWDKWSVWDGQEITKQTPEYINGQLVYVTGHFRKYKDYENCLRDYMAGFLPHVRNNKGYKYACIQGMKDPAAVIRRIRIGTGTPEHPEGYCTDPNYEQKILKIIMDNDLTRFDGVVKDIYAVRRDFDDIKYQLGLFHVLDNAKKVADENWGYKVYNTDTKELVYQPMLKEVEKYVSTLVWMDQLARDDIAAEKYWSYQNKNTQELSKTFDAARKTGNRHTNCVTGVQWGMLKAGICERDGIQWYGNGKIVWLNSHAKADAEKYFQIIDVYEKTLKKCINEHFIQLGDTITYTDMAHTNVYIGNKQSYDTGHAYCTGSGEGAFFKKWIGDTPYMSHKVAQILRPYGSWRVQCGVFTVKKNASALVAKLKKAGFDAMIVTEGKNYIVQAGLFDYKDNAVRLCEKIKAAGFDCLVKGIPC